MDTSTENETTNQHPAILVQTRGAGKGCKGCKIGAKMLKAAHRRDGKGYSLKEFTRKAAACPTILGNGWWKRRRKDPTPKTNHPKRQKHPSDHESKGNARAKATRFPILMASNRHRHQ